MCSELAGLQWKSEWCDDCIWRELQGIFSIVFLNFFLFEAVIILLRTTQRIITRKSCLGESRDVVQCEGFICAFNRFRSQCVCLCVSVSLCVCEGSLIQLKSKFMSVTKLMNYEHNALSNNIYFWINSPTKSQCLVFAVWK